jgi:hypothetical protein
VGTLEVQFLSILASCGSVSLVSTSSDSVDGSESLENKKQIDTSVSEVLLKVLEILSADTKAFLQPALAPPAVQRKESLKRFLLKFNLQRNQSP